MVLLLDIGNTHTHLGLGDDRRVRRQTNIPTRSWLDGSATRCIRRFVGNTAIDGAAACSVVPKTTPKAVLAVKREWNLIPLLLTPRTVRGIGIDYPRPETIGPDRLANAVAAEHHCGAPAVVVDFGTAVTFDVVDRRANYIGGIIAPGLAAMTDYLHEKTALLPRIRIREISAIVGRNTEQAMLIGAVHGYRGLIRELLIELKRALKCKELAVVATGGYAALMAEKLPEINAVMPWLTLEGLRLTWYRTLKPHCPR
jgi:type III pantothenate kinase